MPSGKGYVRDFKQEAKTAKQRGEQGVGSKSGSAKRHKARRKMLKEGKTRRGQDVDHKRPIRSGGGNNRENLRSLTPSANRSFSRKK